MSEQLIQTPGTFGENGNFLLERELGSGGMGGVYMGRDKMLDRPVAVKVMLKEYGADPEFVEKFKKEAQAAARLVHPNIVQIYSYGICDEMPYIAMELASGGSLYSIMSTNPGHADITRVLKICQQTAQALQCASDQGFVHGDVKPENILLDANGNAKLVDFGLAAMQKDTDEIWGTPYYISPEKVRKEVVDFRADMYSLGGTLYHALTGVAPFEGEDSIAVVKKRFEGMPRKPSEIRPEITPAIDALVMTMLALNKEDRFPSFEALLQAFTNVLTTGLTQKIPDASLKAVTGTRTVGTRRMTVRGRRMMTAKRTSTSAIAHAAEPTNTTDGAAAKPDDEEDEESGGNLGLKVAIFIVGGLLLIGGIIGGLFWFKAASEAAEKAAIEAQIRSGFDKAEEAISDTVKKAGDFANEFDTFTQRAVEECQKTNNELEKILSEEAPEQAKKLKIEPTKDLLDAIALTNGVPVVAPPAPAAPAATNAVAVATNAAPAATNAVKNAKEPAQKGGAQKGEAKPSAPKPEAKPEAEEPLLPAVEKMHELWELAYGCQACAIRIRHQTTQLLKKAEAAAAFKDKTRENMEQLANLSRTLVEMFEQIKASPDVINVKKTIPLIKAKGKSVYEQTVKRMRIEKLERERKNKAAEAAAAEKERQAKFEEENKIKIKNETETVDAAFEALQAQGSLRQLDWKNSIRQLEVVKAELTTPEAQLNADLQIRKVNSMKKMHEILVRNLNGYAFRGKLRGSTVKGVTTTEITLTSGKTTRKITWQKFLKEYPGNLNEIINVYVLNGRRNAKPALNLKDWAEAMTGAALTMQLVCNEVNGAIERASFLAKEAVKQFPEYAEAAKQIFPKIFEDAEN